MVRLIIDNLLEGGLQVCLLVLVDQIPTSDVVAQFQQNFLGQHFTVVLAARLTALPVAGNLVTHGYILIEGILKPSEISKVRE